MTTYDPSTCVWEADESDQRPDFGTLKTLWCVTHDSAHLDDSAPTGGRLHPVFLEALKPFAPILFEVQTERISHCCGEPVTVSGFCAGCGEAA